MRICYRLKCVTDCLFYCNKAGYRVCDFFETPTHLSNPDQDNILFCLVDLLLEVHVVRVLFQLDDKTLKQNGKNTNQAHSVEVFENLQTLLHNENVLGKFSRLTESTVRPCRTRSRKGATTV
jgi:tRNA(Leu) C34 or U34 (ribose-2'-O)-methylase TrmL